MRCVSMPVMDGIYRVADRSGMTTMAEKGEPQVRFVDSGNRGPLIFFEPRLLHRRFHGTSFEVLPTAPPGFARRRSFLEPAERLRVTMALETMFPQAGAPSALLPQPRRPPSFSRLHGNAETTPAACFAKLLSAGAGFWNSFRQGVLEMDRWLPTIGLPRRPGAFPSFRIGPVCSQRRFRDRRQGCRSIGLK
ncbi:hypothetical protein [Mesorhizobium retamae]|uniref:Uncharacterized protein n=1 Tax=Mesorhizobium retamae TaxID=2912854 RepID=A0ABS9QNV8_9HYPH|nr:hypothetical protein [Mesorhizobium sp. IRAMC:0171]MCG7509131.1 hypothetical protein [Mesorhizobium sp. IRAMC:0171]